jgi:hypothetical protein
MGMFELEFIDTYKKIDIFQYRDTGELLFMRDTANGMENIGSISVPENSSAQKYVPAAKTWIDIWYEEHPILSKIRNLK